MRLHKTKEQVQTLRSHRHFSKGAVFAVAFGLIGAFAVIRSFAATPTAHFESESAVLNNSCAAPVTDSAASGGTALSLNCVEVPPPPPPTSTRGAQLPISYSLSSLTGTVRYVAPNGSDTAAGTAAAPYATLSRAVSASTSGNTIVVRGGTYRDQGAISIGTKTLKIIAYPGEVPIFNGARQVTSGWTTEGTYQYISYNPVPVTTGTMNIAGGQGIVGGTSGAGMYSDQAWIGNTALQQVVTKTALTPGKFFVDRTNNRLYMTSTDSVKTGIEVSQRDKFITIDSPNSSLEGLKITRYSNSGDDYGVVLARWDADNLLIKNVEVSDVSLEAIFLAGNHPGGNWLNNVRLQNVSVDRTNWLAVHAGNINDFVMDSSKITNLDPWNEMNPSPVSGAIKFGRAWGTKLTNNELTNLNSHGFWWDDSNYKTVVANNQITNITGSAIFYEISDDILLINNLITGTSGSQPLKLAGASGVKLVNNTIVGGRDQVGLYTDNRSVAPAGEKPCYDWTRVTPCGPEGDQWANNWDKERVRPVTLDWRPRLDLSINNIFAYPSGSGSFCGGTTALMCITTKHSLGAIVPLQDIIHKADYPYPGLPQTLIDSNVYVNGIISINQGEFNRLTNFTSLTGTTGFTATMAAAPVGIAGLEANGRYLDSSFVSTNGTPTGLASSHNQAMAIPSNPLINAYIPAGTRHYGVTYK